ncbi:MAG TPA: energy-coupling factor transporter transmembrane component T [Candidatus Binatia bacterium]|nr:energy-coupling factor transporter transmembrane component T [Candidatus Binatia bacterium]
MPQAEIAKKTLLGVVPVSSPFYAFHPVTRLTMLVFLSVAPLFIDVPEINLVLIGVMFGLLRWGRVRLMDLRKYTPLVVTVALFMFTIAFVSPGDTERLSRFELAGLTFYFEPMWWAFVSYVRLMAMLLGAILYFSTNRERDVLVALRSLRVPYPVSYTVGLSLRSAGMFMQDFATIREAEQARALDLESMSLRDKLKLYTMYTVPLFAVALRRADEISTALFARGYTLSGRPGTGGKRTDYIRDRFVMRPADWLVSLALIALFVAIAIIGRTTGLFAVEASPLRAIVAAALGVA